MRTLMLSLSLIVAAVACSSDKSTGPRDPAPTIVGISPANGTAGTELTITGTNFRAGALVFVGTVAAEAVELTGASTIYARVPGGVNAGIAYSVRVRNTDGSEAQLASAFTAVAPTLRFVNGATLPSGNVGSTVILEGLAFGDVQGGGAVLFSDGGGGTISATIADAQDDWTNTFIVTTVPNGAASGNVVVRTGTGTSNALTFTITSAATFSPSTIKWTASTALPAGLSGHKANFAAVGSTNLVYVTGGAEGNNTPSTGVYFSTVAAAGGVGAWTSTAALPAGRAFHASIAATPANSRVLTDSASIYVLGGASSATGTPVTTVYRGRLNANGSVRDWVETTPLPVPLHSFGALVFRGEVYIVGGATTANEPTTGVYRARIDSTGMIGAWQALPSLPAARAHHGVVVFGRFLYAVGGSTDAVGPNSGSLTTARTDAVTYAAINLRTGGLAQSSWTQNTSTLTKATTKQGVVAAGGTLFMNAGLYSAANTGSSENSYATINADGSVGSFSGATGSNTIQSAGGGNLFNHAALSYVDALGVARVLVLGGDDVNAPGTKRSAVWYY